MYFILNLSSRFGDHNIIDKYVNCIPRRFKQFLLPLIENFLIHLDWIYNQLVFAIWTYVAYRVLTIVPGIPVRKNRLFKVKTARGLPRKSDEVFSYYISEHNVLYFSVCEFISWRIYRCIARVLNYKHLNLYIYYIL